MSENIDKRFMLRPFCDNDYHGFVDLRNTLFPDHQTTVEQVYHHDKSHDGKIQQFL